MNTNRFNEGVVALLVIALLALVLLTGFGYISFVPQAQSTVQAETISFVPVYVYQPQAFTPFPILKYVEKECTVSTYVPPTEEKESKRLYSNNRKIGITKSFLYTENNNSFSLLAQTITNATTSTTTTIPEEQPGGKVTVCHKISGQGKAHHALSISVNALQAHLDHGDVQGECQP